MNSEHYRLEALKVAELWLRNSGSKADHCIEVAEKFYQWIIQDQVKAEQAKKESEKPQYKIPPSQKITPSDQRDYLSE